MSQYYITNLNPFDTIHDIIWWIQTSFSPPKCKLYILFTIICCQKMVILDTDCILMVWTMFEAPIYCVLMNCPEQVDKFSFNSQICQLLKCLGIKPFLSFSSSSRGFFTFWTILAHSAARRGAQWRRNFHRFFPPSRRH